jgi:AraC-like DNA-binding protein/quercetin dioxygenase-like cupin family protein
MAFKDITDGYMKWPNPSNVKVKVMCWTDDRSVETHRHDFIEIAFMAYGSCVHTYHGSSVKIIPGDVFVITPNEDHSYKIDSKTVIYNCLFYPEFLGEDWNRLCNLRNIFDFLIIEPFYRIESKRQEILHLLPNEAVVMETHLKGMLQEQDSNHIDFEIMQKSNLVILLCFLGRIWAKQFQESQVLYSGKRDSFVEALRYIENNIHSNLRIEDIAAKAYLSPNYFCKVFKDTTGVTPIEYINRIRISKACSQLKDGNLTIFQISEIVGINDVNYFSRLFKSIEGCSPSEYRKRCGN